MGMAESKNDYGKAKAKRSGNDPADRPVSEQQANSGNRSATEEVKTELKTGSSSNAGGRRSNPQVDRLLKDQANPSPKRGDVKKQIFKEAVGLAASACGCCCSSSTSTLDVDNFLNDVPFPTKNQAMATLWSNISE